MRYVNGHQPKTGVYLVHKIKARASTYYEDSDSVPTQAILEYKLGIKTKEEVLDSLKKAASMK